MIMANACCTPVSPPIPHMPLSCFSPCLCLLQNSSVKSTFYESHMATSPGEEYPSATKPVHPRSINTAKSQLPYRTTDFIMTGTQALPLKNSEGGSLVASPPSPVSAEQCSHFTLLPVIIVLPCLLVSFPWRSSLPELLSLSGTPL